MPKQKIKAKIGTLTLDEIDTAKISCDGRNSCNGCPFLSLEGETQGECLEALLVNAIRDFKKIKGRKCLEELSVYVDRKEKANVSIGN